jgi:hypothetical protein
MIDLYELYQQFASTYNISVNGWWRIQTDFVNACNAISYQLWDRYTGMAEKSQEIVDKLIYFQKSKNLIVTPAKGNYGTFQVPTGYERFSSGRILVHNDDSKCIACQEVDEGKCDNGTLDQEQINDEYLEGIVERQVDKISNIQWGACLEHLTKAPTFENPKMTQIDGGFKVAPRQVSVIVLDYYIKPAAATFAYDLTPFDAQTGSGAQVIYKKSESQPLPWPTTMIPEFIDLLGSKYSTFVQDGFLSQSAAQERQFKKVNT